MAPGITLAASSSCGRRHSTMDRCASSDARRRRSGRGRAGARAGGAGARRRPARPHHLRPNFPKYKQEFLAKVKDLSERQVEIDTALQCQPPGVPRIGPPAKIVQTAREVLFLYDDVNGSFFRIIPTDGRAHRKDLPASYLGDAIGSYEGDTLVVETVNFNEETWLTDNGAFHTKDLKVIERLRRVGDTIQYQATAYDPAVLAEPWKERTQTLWLTRPRDRRVAALRGSRPRSNQGRLASRQPAINVSVAGLWLGIRVSHQPPTSIDISVGQVQDSPTSLPSPLSSFVTRSPNALYADLRGTFSQLRGGVCPCVHPAESPRCLPVSP